jgi:hypothetical protein
MKFKPVLSGLSFEELIALLGAYPPFRSKQICEWICR